MPAIVVNELCVDYGDRRAVDHLSFHADYGRILVVLGPNGAGKSSTIERLEGYQKPSSGSITVSELTPFGHQRELAQTIGVMLQNGGVNPRMTPKSTLQLTAQYYPNPQSPSELIDRLDLGGVQNTPFRRLSGGEKQRVLLALALIGRPRIVFLDEPTAGVDPVGRGVIRDMIAQLRSGGVCVVLTTHELSEAERLADDVLIITQGRSVYYGTLETLREQSGGSHIAFESADMFDLAPMEAAIGSSIRRSGTTRHEILGPPTPSLMTKVASYLESNSINYQHLGDSVASLEEMYLKLVSKDNTVAADQGEARR